MVNRQFDPRLQSSPPHGAPREVMAQLQGCEPQQVVLMENVNFSPIRPNNPGFSLEIECLGY